jgi:hypothetical protein
VLRFLLDEIVRECCKEITCEYSACDEPMFEEDDNRRLWIDALCINQHDIEERNAQVKNMSDIYEQASQVLVWLGKANSNIEKVIDLLDTVYAIALDTGEEKINFKKHIREDPDVFDRGAWGAFYDLLSRPYWGRLWVIQEIDLSWSFMSVICGDQSTEWDILHNTVGLLSDDPLTWVENYGLHSKKLGIYGPRGEKLRSRNR